MHWGTDRQAMAPPDEIVSVSLEELSPSGHTCVEILQDLAGDGWRSLSPGFGNGRTALHNIKWFIHLSLDGRKERCI